MESEETSQSAKQKVAVPKSPISGQNRQSSIPLSSSVSVDPPSSAPSSFHSGSSKPKAPKVAIPRLRRPSVEKPSSKAASTIEKNRVSHACGPCRHRKTKCSGERPVCQHCQDFQLTCFYADGKRDRTRKRLDNLADRVEEYEELLKDLSLRVGLNDQDMIRKTLDREQSSDDDSTQAFSNPRGRPKEAPKTPGEEKASARVGSTESMDRISEDFNRGPNVRATGFYGKNSELTWMQRLRKQVTIDSSDDGDEAEEASIHGGTAPGSDIQPQDPDFTSISASSYHCDDLTILLHEDINAYELPSRDTANHLFQNYLDTVHPSFPIIGRNTFVQQFNSLFHSPDQRKPSSNWLAILNMIFAVSARYLHLVHTEWQHDAEDDLIYFTRARMLGFNADAILGHAELQKVQITGLMAFYLMAINQINRSWAVSGIAVRHASTLGLNLRNESKDVTDGSKEIRCRVWWALCSIERMLSVMTGRPTSFDEHDCTAPLPHPVEEDSFPEVESQSPQVVQVSRYWSRHESQQRGNIMTATNNESSIKKSSSAISQSPVASKEPKQPFPPCNALAFRHQIQLSTFTNEVLNRLYRAAGMSETWAHVQSTIADLNAKLESWRQRLPSVFDFSRRQLDQQFSAQRMNLGLAYYSTFMVINRPCLCRVDRKIPDESDRARTFNRETAARCVYAACGMLKLLPDEPNAISLYRVAPWWCLVHQLMQAATVLMLELSFRADHMKDALDEVFSSARKALEWLRSLSVRDEAARRASILCNELLRQVASKVGKRPEDASDFEPGGEYSIQSIAEMQNQHGPVSDFRTQSFASSQTLQDTDSVDPYRGGENIPNVQTQQPGYYIYQDLQAPSIGHGPPPIYQSQQGFSTSAPFQPQLFTTYDQLPFHVQAPQPLLPAPYSGMFSTAIDMGGMDSHEDVAPNYPHEQDRNWSSGKVG